MKVLVCGTRRVGKPYNKLVDDALNEANKRHGELLIIEGCCKDSADEYAEQWAERHDVPIKHYPSKAGNFLKRNVEMVKEAQEVLAFWDGWSYGTAHTIAQAVLHYKDVHVIPLRGALK